MAVKNHGNSKKTRACAGLGQPSQWFGNMIQNCYEYATRAKAAGRPIVGIMCEYTPRELIMAAGAVPVCLCGGSAETATAAEGCLPTGICPLIKSTFGYHVRKANPFLEMADLLAAETTCDGKKKMYEIMAQDRPVYILELPQKPDDPDAQMHWVKEIYKFRDELERRFCVSITGGKIARAISDMNTERKLRRQMAELMKGDCPPLTGRQLLDFRSIISGNETDLEQYRAAIKQFGTQTGTGRKDSKVRVLMTGVPVVHGAERVVEIIEGHGGLVVCMDNCTGLKPILEDVDASAKDPIEALARKYLHIPCSVMTRNDRRLEMMRELAGEYRPQCIIELVWHNCITYDVESYFVKRLAEELGLPYMKIETDYSPSDSARIALRVEALFETVRGRGK